MTPKSPRPVRAAVTAFAVVTAVLPSRFRHAFGPEMREAFEDEAVERYQRSGVTGVTATTCVVRIRICLFRISGNRQYA